jgi:uncharacterized phosphatase
VKTVYFSRHGEAEANKQGLLAGAKSDSPLTASGREHGHDIANALKGKRIDLIVTSPLARASDTAKIIAKDIGYVGEIIENSIFIERDFGSVTNMPKADAFKRLDDGTASGVESVFDFGNRARSAIQWLETRHENNILIVSHGAFGQMLGTLVNGGHPEDFLSYKTLENAEIFEIKIEEAKG